MLNEALVRRVIYPYDLNRKHGPRCFRGQARARVVW